MNKQGFTIICIGLVVIVLAAHFLADTLGGNLCANRVLREIPSPNGQLKAVVFVRECAGTPESVNQLSVLGSGDQLPKNKPGNVLPEDEAGVKAYWDTDSVLIVKYDRGTKTYVKEDSIWVMKLPWPAMVTVKSSAN